MKTTKFNIALLLVAMAFSAYVSGQQNIFQEDKYQLDPSDESEIIMNDTFDPNDVHLEPFKARIYPNPSLTGKVKMSWMDNQEVDYIILIPANFGNGVEMIVNSVKEITINNLENGNYHVKFYFNQKLLGTQKLIVMKE